MVGGFVLGGFRKICWIKGLSRALWTYLMFLAVIYWEIGWILVTSYTVWLSVFRGRLNAFLASRLSVAQSCDIWVGDSLVYSWDAYRIEGRIIVLYIIIVVFGLQPGYSGPLPAMRYKSGIENFNFFRR